MVFQKKGFIASKIRLARKRANITQAKLAEMIDISVQQLSRIEVGAYIPSVPTFLKIIEVLNMSLDEFGINTYANENPIRESLIKQLFTLNDTELECCKNAMQTALENYVIVRYSKLKGKE